MNLEDVITACISTGHTVDIDFEFIDSLHMYEGVTVTELTEDGYIVMKVPFFNEEEKALYTLEVTIAIERIVKITRVVARLTDDS